MRFFPVAIALLVACPALVALFSVEVDAQESKGKVAEIDFAGRFVTVYVHGDETGAGQILHHVETVRFGGRLWLSGTCADTGRSDDWTTGVQYVVPLDDVQSMYLMRPNEFEEKIRQSNPRY